MKQPITIQARAFNISYDGIANALMSDVHICAAFSPVHRPGASDLKKYLAIWDTGATNSVITPKVVQESNLKPIGVTNVETANGQHLSDVFLASIWLPNKVSFPQVRVTQGTIGGVADVLIGMDIICRGDFAVSNMDGKTNFTFRIPSVECLDFVKQQPSLVQSGPQTLHKVGRNDPCPCGSGRKYKRCHGR